MKSKITHSLIISLILMVGYLTSVTAVTDAELEALEKQIAQEEAKEQQRKAAIKKQQQEATKRQAEKQAEAKREKAAEQQRLADMEKQRQEQQFQLEAEKQLREAELERKQQEQEKRSQYNLLISAADRASDNKDYELAEEKYSKALVLYPDDNKALAGIKFIQDLINACDKAVGAWAWFHGGDTNIYADGTIDGTWTIFSNTGTWECKDPAKRLVILRWKTGGWIDNLILSEDGTELKGKNQHGSNVSGIKK